MSAHLNFQLYYRSIEPVLEIELFLLPVGIDFAMICGGILYSCADLRSFFSCSISWRRKLFSFSFLKYSCLWFRFSFSIWFLRDDILSGSISGSWGPMMNTIGFYREVSGSIDSRPIMVARYPQPIMMRKNIDNSWSRESSKRCLCNGWL